MATVTSVSSLTELLSHPYVFVTGCPRSGTTLLAVLLGRHPDFSVTAESKLLCDVQFQSCWKRFKSLSDPRYVEPALRELLAAEFLKDLELQPEEILAVMPAQELIKISDSVEFLSVVLTAHRLRDGKARIVEKTPDHLHHVDEILRKMPNAKVICIVRDGRDSAISMTKMPMGYGDHKRYSVFWIRSAKRQQKVSQQYPDRILTLRYEDLLRSPQEELSRITNFIDCEYDPCMLVPSQTSNAIPEHELAWKAKASNELDPSRCEAWRRSSKQKAVISITKQMKPYLKQFGYDVSNVSDDYSIRERCLDHFYYWAFHPSLQRSRSRFRQLLEQLGLWK